MDRIQKILARGGIASRRAAEQMITAGRVRVNGKVVTELGAKADPFKDKIELDGKRVVAEDLIYVVLHKPRGVVATLHDPEGRPTVKELFSKIGQRLYPVGRLDFATSGVLLATNDGAFADGLLHPKRSVPKTYVLKVKGKMEEADFDRWRKGVELEDGKTLPADAKLIRHEADKTWFELTIREGRNQQIRRMGEATRFTVMRLARVEFAGVSSEGLKPGEWRYLTREELQALKKEYGVPRSIPAIPAQPHPKKMRSKSIGIDRHGHAKSTRSGTGGPSPAAYEASFMGNDESPPRYGGGSPGRRGYEVKEDWGGGSGRGRSSRGGSDDRRDAPPPGRGGRSRTTGTAGGPGARTDMPRVPSRRGR